MAGENAKIRRILDTVLTVLDCIMVWICYFLLVVIVCITSLQVFLRFIFKSPVSWSEEVALLLLIWFGMIALARAVRHHGHIAITAVRDLLPLAAAHGLDVFAQFLTLGFGIALVFQGDTLVQIVGLQTLPASDISKTWLYYPIIVGGVLMAINALGNILTGETAPRQKTEEDRS